MELCIECKAFYDVESRPFGACPQDDNHLLLHPTKCQHCATTMYFQTDDDFCAPDGDDGIICGECATKLVEGGLGSG